MECLVEQPHLLASQVEGKARHARGPIVAKGNKGKGGKPINGQSKLGRGTLATELASGETQWLDFDSDMFVFSPGDEVTFESREVPKTERQPGYQVARCMSGKGKGNKGKASKGKYTVNWVVRAVDVRPIEGKSVTQCPVHTPAYAVPHCESKRDAVPRGGCAVSLDVKVL